MFRENLSLLLGMAFLSPFTGGVYSEPEQISTQLNNSNDFVAIAQQIATKHPEITPERILAIGDRESHLGALLDSDGLGDNGNGCGWLQIDKRYHPNFVEGVDCATDHYEIAEYAIEEVYLSYLKQLDGNHDHALAAYNAGVSSVKKAVASGLPADSVTTGKNYGADVKNRMAKFK